MTEQEFDDIVNLRLDTIKTTLIIKGKEYRRNNDPLHNFNQGSKITGKSRETVLWGFALKHLISFMDILNDIEDEGYPAEEVVEEKIGDLINYLILCEASIKDKLKTSKPEFAWKNPRHQKQ
jgi:hypothetical protein